MTIRVEIARYAADYAQKYNLDLIDLTGPMFEWLDEANPACAREQLHRAYAHGGGWHRFDGFHFNPTECSLEYPGDPAMPWVARGKLREELVILFAHAWVAIVQPDGSFEVARMD